MKKQLTKITLYDIQAFADHELDDEESARICKFIQSDESAGKYYERICLQKRLLQLWWENG